MHNTAVALFTLSSIVSLFGGYLRDQFIYTDERPIDEDVRNICKAQKRLCVGFFVMAGLGLALAITNALAFAIFHLTGAEAFWMVVVAGAWLVAVLTLFTTTYGSMQKAKVMFGSW